MTRTLYVTKRTTPADIECVILAKLGFSRKCIASRTGLSEGQISNQLRIAGIHLTDYRNGESSLATKIIDVVEVDSVAYFNSIKNLLAQGTT